MTQKYAITRGLYDAELRSHVAAGWPCGRIYRDFACDAGVVRRRMKVLGLQCRPQERPLHPVLAGAHDDELWRWITNPPRKPAAMHAAIELGCSVNTTRKRMDMLQRQEAQRG